MSRALYPGFYRCMWPSGYAADQWKKGSKGDGATAPPNAPTTLAATPSNYFTVGLTWAAPAGGEVVTSYRIYRGTASGGPYVQVGSTTMTSFNDTSCTSSTQYFYVVRAVNSQGESPNSNEATATTPLVTTPDKPTGLAASNITETAMQLDWNAVTNDPGLTHYMLDVSGSGSGTGQFQVNVPLTTYQLTGLSSATQYTITVEAINRENVKSGPTTPITPTTLAYLPNPATNLQGTGNGTAELSWTASVVDPTHDPPTAYKIERQQGGGGFSVIDSVTPPTVAYSDSPPDGTYDYRIVASNSRGDAAPSNQVTVSVTTPPVATFQMRVKTDNVGSSPNDSFWFSMSAGSYSGITIDWGDGQQTNPATAMDWRHQYAAAGEYDIEVSGARWQGYLEMNNAGDRLKVLSVSNFGESVLGNGAFYGCTNLISTATDSPAVGTGQQLNSWFRECSSIVTGVSGIDPTKGVIATQMITTFQGASAFNGPMSGWNVSNVTNFQQCFDGCTVFNQDISGWNMSAATNISYMFQNCPAFNQPIGAWNTAAVTTMLRTLLNATNFNQSLAGWNVGLVTTMSLMLQGSTLSTPNYDATLISWGGQSPSLQNSVPCHMGNAQYTTGGAAESARTVLTGTHSWTITDGGPAP